MDESEQVRADTPNACLLRWKHDTRCDGGACPSVVTVRSFTVAAKNLATSIFGRYVLNTFVALFGSVEQPKITKIFTVRVSNIRLASQSGRKLRCAPTETSKGGASLRADWDTRALIVDLTDWR